MDKYDFISEGTTYEVFSETYESALVGFVTKYFEKEETSSDSDYYIFNIFCFSRNESIHLLEISPYGHKNMILIGIARPTWGETITKKLTILTNKAPNILKKKVLLNKPTQFLLDGIKIKELRESTKRVPPRVKATVHNIREDDMYPMFSQDEDYKILSQK